MSRWFGFLLGALVFLAYGVLCLIRFPIERQRAIDVPRMTCGQFLQRWPGAEQYVTLTDVRLCRSGFAFWRDAMSPSDVDVFIPVYPGPLQQEPPPRDLELLLEVQDSDAWQRIREAEVVEVTCLVQPGAGRVDDWAQEVLRTRYPGLRLANLRVVTVGLHEPTMATARSLLNHGIVGSSVGVVALVVLLGRRKTTAMRSEVGASEES